MFANPYPRLVPLATWDSSPSSDYANDTSRRVDDELDPDPSRRILQVDMTAEDDIERVAEHLADLTRTVEAMAVQLQTLSDRTDSQQTRVDSQQQRTEVQQERIDVAARELADVSERLQAAANALRESI